MKQALSTLSLIYCNLLITIIVYLLLTVSLLNTTLRGYSLFIAGGEGCVEFFCVGDHMGFKGGQRSIKGRTTEK